MFGLSFFSLAAYKGHKMNNLMWPCMVGEVMFCFLMVDTRPYFQWNMNAYGSRSPLYLPQLCIRFIFYFIDNHDPQSWSQVSLKQQSLFILLHYNPHISKFYNMDQNSRVPYQTIYITYLDHIWLLLVCGNYLLTLNKGGCWNLLE